MTACRRIPGNSSQLFIDVKHRFRRTDQIDPIYVLIGKGKANYRAAVCRRQLKCIAIPADIPFHIGGFQNDMLRIERRPATLLVKIEFSPLSDQNQITVISYPGRRLMRQPDSLKTPGVRRIKPAPAGIFILNGKRCHSVRNGDHRENIPVGKTPGVERT